jgi:hypothetical protein
MDAEKHPHWGVILLAGLSHAQGDRQHPQHGNRQEDAEKNKE